jgi:hypothetical protein
LAGAAAKLTQHNLGAFMDSSSIFQYLSDAAAQNSSILTYQDQTHPKYVVMNHNSENKDYQKNLILFIGSLHGGSPLSSYTVMSYLDQFLNDHDTNPIISSILEKNKIIFMPIANYPAYKYVEENYANSSKFIDVQSDLSTVAECNISTSGIDPDRNFPSGFKQESEKCDQEGYTGDDSLTSTISKKISELLDHPLPLVFLFNKEGRKIFTPFAQNDSQVEGNYGNFYNNTGDHRTKDYSYLNFGKNDLKYGSLLDYVADKKGVAFEIWGEEISKVTENDVDDIANETFNFIVNSVDHVSINGVYANSTYDYFLCKDCSDMGYDFNFFVKAKTLTEVKVDIDLKFEFSAANVSLNDSKAVQEFYDKSTLDRTECTISGFNLVCENFVIEGYSLVNFNFTFIVPNTTNSTVTVKAKIQTSKNSFYSEPLTIEFTQKISDEDDSSSSDDDSSSSDDDGHGRRGRKGVVVGFVLLIVLLVLLLIAGIILCCTQKKPKEEPQNFAPGNIA